MPSEVNEPRLDQLGESPVERSPRDADRLGDHLSRTKQLDLGDAGRVAPRRHRLDRDFMEPTKDEKRRAGQGFLELLGYG
jgi:hypothetical protein